MKIGFVHLKGHFAVNIRNSAIYNFLVSNGMNIKDILVDETGYLEASFKQRDRIRYINFANILALARGIVYRQSTSLIFDEISFNSLIKKFGMMIKGEFKNLLEAAKECDALHAEDMWCGYMCLLVKKKINKPYVLDLHDSHVTASSAWGAPVRKVQYYRTIESKAVRGAKFVTAVSKHARDYLAGSYGKPENEIFVAPNGTQLQAAKACFQRPFKIIYLGGLESIYSPFDFIRTAEALHDNRYKFYILGNGSLRNELIDYINRNSLDVTYLGFKNREKALQILCQMQAGIYTVRDHIANRIAAPLKVLDYATCGLPVISPRINETSSLVQKYDCGIVVQRNDPAEFAKAIKELDRKDIWEKKSNNAKRMVQKEFTWERTLQPLLTIYKDLIFKK